MSDNVVKSNGYGEEDLQSLKLLTADDILSANDIQYEYVDVPEWGGLVRVKMLTAGERDAFEQSLMVSEVQGGKERHKLSLEDVRAKFVARVLCDNAGKPLFSAIDIARLSQKSAAGMSRVYNAAARLNGMLNEDVEELAKNSGGVQRDAYSSPSVETGSTVPRERQLTG
jgi:hypothetical protein